MQKNVKDGTAIAVIFGALTALGILLGVLFVELSESGEPNREIQQDHADEPYEPYEPTICVGCGVGVPIGGGLSVF